MQVTLIGSGNVATVMGKQLCSLGHRIMQVYSRDTDHAAALAKQISAGVAEDISAIRAGADMYLLAVTDDAVHTTVASLQLGPDALLVHTAGSISKDILKNAAGQYGVLWPMKMIRKSMPSLGEVLMVIDAGSAATLAKVKEVAGIFSSNILVADDDKRGQLHLLASLTANFSNHLYHLAETYCTQEGIDFKNLLPIIKATVDNLGYFHPAEMQAGPAFRGDAVTIEKHLSLLENYPDIAGLYKALSESIRLVAARQ